MFKKEERLGRETQAAILGGREAEGNAEKTGKRQIIKGQEECVYNKPSASLICRHKRLFIGNENFFIRTTHAEFSCFSFDYFRIVFQILNFFLNK